MSTDSFWLLLLSILTMLMLRRLLLWGSGPLNRQTIRRLFLQRLLVLVPSATLISEGDDQLMLRVGELPCTIRLDNLYRRCAELPAQTAAFIHQATTALQQAVRATNDMPEDWPARVMPLLLPAQAADAGALAHQHAVAGLAVGYAVEREEAFRWITPDELPALGTTAEEVQTLAMRNLERSCSQLVIQTPGELPDGTDRVLRFTTGDGLDATRLLLPSFYQRFSPRFGDADLLVAVPTRDTLVMIAAADTAQGGVLAWRSREEVARGAYPLTRTLLLVSETGVTRWSPEADEAPAPTAQT